jgi:hypothetical protein
LEHGTVVDALDAAKVETELVANQGLDRDGTGLALAVAGSVPTTRRPGSPGSSIDGSATACAQA